jgi:tetratricopeptide (TPR) repeat protein
MATRLHAVTDAGSIVISPATHQRVALFFECESLGAQRVRGMAQPVELFKVIKEAASRNRVELVDPGNLTPLVGRDTELTILKDRWEQALDELGQIVLLVGDAGLGKSRLIRELREHVIREDSAGAAVIELRCSQYHQNAPYFPLVECLSQMLRFEHHSAAERLELVLRYLRELKLETADNVALFCNMLGVPTDSRFPSLNLPPAKLKERTEELLLLWLKQLIAVSPVLFIVEDLHWVDPSTVGLVERHVEQFEIDRALTLLTFRPEFEPPWKSKPHTTHIALNRLTKRQIGEMMRKLTKRKEIPEAILHQVIERTDGIPLFIEEFSAVILESGILDRADAGADAASLLNVIPATLKDLLLARLDRMKADREVIQFAATIGREFSFELLVACCTLKEADLQRELDKLVHAEILFRKGTGADASYIFKHALLQDAAYRSMLTKKRQGCHQRIAEVLETRFAEVAASQPALLAQHFQEAGLIDKAIEWWLKAGQRSAAASAVPEAIQQFQRGLDLVRSLPESVHRDELELQYQMPLGGVLVQAKGYGANEPGEVFAHARGICEKLGRRQELGLVLAGMWGWTLVRAEYPEALRLAEAQVRLGDELNEPGLQGEACWAMTCTLFYMGRYAEASAQARRGISIHDANPDCWRPYAAVAGQSGAVCERAYLALSMFCLGDLEGALTHSRDAVALARSTKDPFSLAMALYHGAWLRLWAGMTDELKALAEEGLTLCRELSFHFYSVTQQFNVAAVPLLSSNATREQLENFVTTIRAALTAHLGAGSGVFLSKMYGLLADALRRLGRLEDAQVELDKGFLHQEKSGERFCDADLHRLQAEGHYARGNHSAAEQSLNTALRIATAQQAKTWITRAEETRSRW